MKIETAIINKAAWILRRPWFYLLLSSLVLLLRIYEYNMPYVLMDDAYISFRYARNLAAGLGLVFNPGERVEGYTNFLWVLILAFCQYLGFGIVTASKILAGGATFGTLVVIYFLARRLFSGYRYEIILLAFPLLVYSSQGTQARYVVSGMETALFTFLVTFSVLMLFSNRLSWLAGFGFALAAMTRPEGVMYFSIAIIVKGILWFFPSFEGRNRKGLVASVIAFLSIYGVYFLWRYSYFGFLLPNTYYAKASGFQLTRIIRGWEYLLEVVKEWRVYLLLVLAMVSLLSWKRHWAWIMFPMMTGLTFVYFLYVGGDFIVWFGPRFLMPIFPLLLLMASEGLHNVSQSRFLPAPMVLTLQVFIVALIIGISYFYSWPNSRGLEMYFVPQMRAWAEIGQWIKEKTPSDFTIATDAAGLIPYYSERYTYDMFGLTDVHIAHQELDNMGSGIVAHEKTDPQYILNQQPDCIVSTWMDADGNAVSSGLMSVRDQFVEDYNLVAVSKSRYGPPENGRWVIETDTYKPNYFEKGYVTGLFCR
jgi:hypothetical protein